MDSNLIFFQVQRNVLDPKNIHQMVKNISDEIPSDHVNLESIIEDYQEKILKNFDKEKVDIRRGSDYYIECINKKTEKHVKKILQNNTSIKYSIDSSRFEDKYSNCYEIELPKMYKIQLQCIDIERKEYNFFNFDLEFKDTTTDKIIKINLHKQMYNSVNIFTLLSENNISCELKNEIILYDNKKFTFMGKSEILSMLNIYDYNTQAEYEPLPCNLIDIYINNNFVRQINLYKFEPFILCENNQIFNISFFEANTNIPFIFHSIYTLHLLLFN